MSEATSAVRSRTGIWGWAILAVVGGLLAFDGLAWFFVGPEASSGNLAADLGIPAAELPTRYPEAAAQDKLEARWSSIYLMAIGMMGLLAALAGLRHRPRWAWYITWVLVAAPAALLAVALGGTGGELGAFGMLMLGLAVLALAGQLMAGRGLAKA